MAAKTKKVDPLELLPYGAPEIKAYIKKFTFRSFLITISLIALLALVYISNTKLSNAGEVAVPMAPIVKLSIQDLPPPPAAEEADIAPPPDQKMIVNSGPAARAGTPVPVPDAQITPDMQDFATMDIMDRASAEGGDGLDLGGFSDNIDFNEEVDVEVREEEPAPDEFIPVEKEPGVDLAKLQKMIIYPDLARRAGVEGSVVLRVLVDKDGTVKKSLIEFSENELLNQAAIDAVNKYGKFTPAIQNNEPIMCWVSIPIRFKLR